MATLQEMDEEQRRMMDEECIVIDRKDKAIGHSAKKICE